jgi:hypothetical protein
VFPFVLHPAPLTCADKSQARLRRLGAGVAGSAVQCLKAMGARTLRLNDADQPWNLPLTLNSPGSPCRRAVTVSGLSPGQGSGQLTRDNFRLSPPQNCGRSADSTIGLPIRSPIRQRRCPRGAGCAWRSVPNPSRRPATCNTKRVAAAIGWISRPCYLVPAAQACRCPASPAPSANARCRAVPKDNPCGYGPPGAMISILRTQS